VGELHVTNGDSAASSLRQGGVQGTVLAWRDVLHEGPVPAQSPRELAATRARFLAEAFGADAAAVERDLLARDEVLAAGASGRVVLWFDADLYDQLQLVQVLDRLAGPAATGVTLVSIGEYAGRAHFGGLGELAGPDLVDLRRTSAQPVGAAELALARRAWEGFTAPDPRGLLPLMSEHSPVLRHLGEGIERLLQEYPWTGDGLSLTERRILRAIDSGAAGRAQVFKQVWAAERRPFLGDSVCFLILDRLAAAGMVAGAPGKLRLTPVGQDVLAGRSSPDRIDRWVGCVHLEAPAAWRWDPHRETLVTG